MPRHLAEIESEWTARDRELKMFGGPARTFSAQVSVQNTDADLGRRAVFRRKDSKDEQSSFNQYPRNADVDNASGNVHDELPPLTANLYRTVCLHAVPPGVGRERRRLDHRRHGGARQRSIGDSGRWLGDSGFGESRHGVVWIRVVEL